MAQDKRSAFWHNVGRPINASGDPLSQVGLDWEPIVVPMRYDFHGGQRISQGFKILINSKTGKDIAPCSDSWQPLGNREFYNLVVRSLDQVGGSVARGGYMEGSKSSLRLGDRCVFFVSDEIPELGFSLYGDDVEEKHSSRIIFYNHHSPGCGMGVKVIVIRKVCTNGLVKTGIKNGLRVSHTNKGIETYRQSDKVIQEYQELIQKQRVTFEELAKVTVSSGEAYDHFVAIAGDKKKSADEQPIAVKTLQDIYDGSAARIMEDLGVDLSVNDYTRNTAYGVLQSVTAYYSHFRSGFNSVESAIKSRVFTDSASVVDSAYNSLVRAYLPKQKDKVSQSVRAW